MKRRNASLLGNVLMGLGLVVMVVGVGYSILNQLPQLDLPQFFAHGAILSIFVGAVLWLAGARIQRGHSAIGGIVCRDDQGGRLCHLAPVDAAVQLRGR